MKLHKVLLFDLLGDGSAKEASGTADEAAEEWPGLTSEEKLLYVPLTLNCTVSGHHVRLIDNDNESDSLTICFRFVWVTSEQVLQSGEQGGDQYQPCDQIPRVPLHGIYGGLYGGLL